LAQIDNPALPIEQSVQALKTDRELCTAFLAHNRPSLRLALALSDEDATTFSAPSMEAVVMTARAERRRPSARSTQFPVAAAFGRMPTIGKGRRALRSWASEEALQWFVAPVARSAASLPTVPRGAVPRDVAEAASRATRSTAARARGALYLAHKGQ
jgi:hypothetical protein